MMNTFSRIYIAGHTGLVGQGFVRRLQHDELVSLIFKTHQKLDLTDQARVSQFNLEESHDLVILSAAKVGGRECIISQSSKV